jgi:hypothetical protein
MRRTCGSEASALAESAATFGSGKRAFNDAHSARGKLALAAFGTRCSTDLFQIRFRTARLGSHAQQTCFESV